jgi:hypothetical protein
MSLWTKIRGTIETRFQISLGGPQWKNNAGNIEARNPADSGFVIGRGATPVAANDWATKAYVDSGSVIADGGVQLIRFAITTTAAQNSVTQIPSGAIVLSSFFDIQTPFTAGTTLTMGNAGSPALLMGTTDSDATTIGIYEVPQDTAFTPGPATLLVTVAGGPIAGAGFACVEYVQGPQP